MSMPSEPTKQEIQELLSELDCLIYDARDERAELDELGLALQELLESGATSRFYYDLQNEQLRRSYEKSQDCLRGLEQQRKRLIYALGRL